MYVKGLRVSNFRCFEHAELNLRYPGRTSSDLVPNVNLLLGVNGGGKSSILRALAIGILSSELQYSGFVAYRLVRRPGPDLAIVVAELELDPVDRISRDGFATMTAETEIKRGQGSNDKVFLKKSTVRGDYGEQRDTQSIPTLEDDRSASFFVVGYGATRYVDVESRAAFVSRRSRGLRYQRVAGLFEDHVALTPLSGWLERRRHESRFDEVVSLLGRAMPDELQFTGEWDKVEGQFLFEHMGRQTPYPALSDGYKAFIGWIGDLLFHLDSVCPPTMPLDQLPGLVLVDEIDLNLHPGWQRTVIEQVATAFPRLQFVFTTHSPIVAGTVHHAGVFVTESETDGTASVRQYSESLYGKSAEEILLSSYFGLQSSRANSFTEDSRKLFERAASGDTAAAVSYLKRLTHPDEQGLLGNSEVGGDTPPKPKRAQKKRRNKPGSR
jgi:predicted ATPase